MKEYNEEEITQFYVKFSSFENIKREINNKNIEDNANSL